MTGYTKLFASIVTSTVWREPDHVRLVWVTMLALSDRHGVVEASVPGLADMAHVSVKQCREAITRLLGPDVDSRTQDFDGRRIEAVDGGWVLLNHAKYRRKLSADERREYHRIKKAEYRAKTLVSPNVPSMSPNVSDMSTLSTHTEAEAEATPEATTDAEPDAERRAQTQEPTRALTTANPHGKTTNLVNGTDNRFHGEHEWCDPERITCVPARLHRELMARARKSDPEMRAFYVNALIEWGDKPRNSDVFKFWNRMVDTWIGATLPAPVADRTSKGARTADAFRRAVAKLQADGRLSE